MKISTLFYVLYIAILLVPILEQYIPILSYFDELLTVGALAIIFSTTKSNKYLRKIFFYLWLILLLGLISSFYFNYQKNIVGVIKDIFAISKYPLVIYGYSLVKLNRDLMMKKVENMTRAYIFLLFVCSIFSLFVNIGLSQEDIRYGLRPFMFLYSHPTFLVMVGVILLSVVVANGVKRNFLFIVMILSTIVLSLRTKAIIVVVCLLIFLLIRYFGLVKYKRSMIIFSILSSLGITYWVAQDKILNYTTNEQYMVDAARSAMTFVGFQIAAEHFPLGTGFCTFGSSLSAEYYSPVYVKYHLNAIRGIEKGDIAFAADVFWPNIYVQYGIVGCILYLLLQYRIIRYTNLYFVVFSDEWIAAFIILVYSLAASTSEAIFTNTSGVFFPIILVLFIGRKYDTEELLTLSKR